MVSDFLGTGWSRQLRVFFYLFVVAASYSVCRASDSLIEFIPTTNSAVDLSNYDVQPVKWEDCFEDCIHECKHGSSSQESCLDWFLPRSHGTFPLMKSMVEGRDVTLPLPYGISYINTELNRHLIIDDVRLSLGANPPTSVERVSVPETTFHASSHIARCDLWVLPCVNIYGLVGHTRTTGTVEATISQFPFQNSPPHTLNIPVVLEGTTGGFGITTGVGTKDYMLTLDINKTWTDFDKLDSTLTALVITPRIGKIMDYSWWKGEVHVGAMWQDTDQTVELTIDDAVLGNDLNVEVDQTEPRKWNFLVGGLYAIDERLQLFCEGGMGGRSYIISGVTIRF